MGSSTPSSEDHTINGENSNYPEGDTRDVLEDGVMCHSRPPSASPQRMTKLVKDDDSVNVSIVEEGKKGSGKFGSCSSCNNSTISTVSAGEGKTVNGQECNSTPGHSTSAVTPVGYEDNSPSEVTVASYDNGDPVALMDDVMVASSKKQKVNKPKKTARFDLSPGAGEDCTGCCSVEQETEEKKCSDQVAKGEEDKSVLETSF